MLPVPADDARQTPLLTTSLRAGETIDDDVAVVVSTSGTTGAPKGAMLTASALTASAEATHDRLGGPGRWLLALPAYHVAGLQVLVRSVVAGTTPVAVVRRLRRGRIGFRRRVTGVRAGGTRRWWRRNWTRRCGIRRPHAALAELDAVLIGGGPMPRRRRRKSFGGRGFGGADVRDERDGGRLRVRRRGAGRGAGAHRSTTAGWCSAARRWRRVTAIRCEPDPFAEPGWFRTDDIGAVDDSGVLRVLGRVDDAISTGGLTVLPQLVEAALATIRGRGMRGVRRRRRAAGPAGGRGRGGGRRLSRTPTLAELRAHVAQTLDADRRAARGAHRRRAAAPRHRQGEDSRRRQRMAFRDVMFTTR